MNTKLIPNSTQIPNLILDEILPSISEADGKCLLYICRRTYGFHKEMDRISITQFVDGIKDKNGILLDHGCGMSRPAVIGALKNLIGSGLIQVVRTTTGNYYKIDLNFKTPVKAVKEVNRLRKLTGKRSKPKAVNLVNQKRLTSLTYKRKGKKGKESNMSDKLTDFVLKDKINLLLTDKKRHIQIIGVWIRDMKLTPENNSQLQSIIKRSVRAAKLLVGYSNEDISAVISQLQKTDWIHKFTVETISKFIDKYIADKKVNKNKTVVKWIQHRVFDAEGRPQIKVTPVHIKSSI